MADFVTVYCNIPMGLRLRLHDALEETEQVIGGVARNFKVHRPNGAEVVLNGTSAPFGQSRKDAAGNFVVQINGFAATPNVDKDFWDKWMVQNKEHPLLTANPPGLFARAKAMDAQAQAKELAGVKSGLEPMVPTIINGAGEAVQRDPRAPRSVARHEGDRAA